MARSRTILIAGAGIGGLTAALALAQHGFRVVILEKSKRLEETGAGIQPSPNASRIFIKLGLGEALKQTAVAPDAIRIMRSSGKLIVEAPLGPAAEFRFGAPYWVIHRVDLQRALLEAASARPEIELRLGMEFTDYAAHARGVTVKSQGATGDVDEHGIALIGADGLWSNARKALGEESAPRFAGRTAWRAMIPIERAPNAFREPVVHLWLGRAAHLVHYPVRCGRALNIVAIVGDDFQDSGWSTPGDRRALLERFGKWCEPARTLLGVPEAWLKWALFDRAPSRRWGIGPVTLLGDAAHPMLPFLAQGGAMAIEDAAALASCLARDGESPASALRTYEGLRSARTARVQREARRNDIVYHLSGPAALARDMMLRTMGGEKLLLRYRWLYDWRLPPGET